VSVPEPPVTVSTPTSVTLLVKLPRVQIRSEAPCKYQLQSDENRTCIRI
jgi:hypothetical protein